MRHVWKATGNTSVCTLRLRMASLISSAGALLSAPLVQQPREAALLSALVQQPRPGPPGLLVVAGVPAHPHPLSRRPCS